MGLRIDNNPIAFLYVFQPNRHVVTSDLGVLGNDIGLFGLASLTGGYSHNNLALGQGDELYGGGRCLCTRWDLKAHRLVRARSEEHTSELQSHLNLVCRLLLEKKKQRCLAHRLI